MTDPESSPVAAAEVAIFDLAGDLLLGRHAHDERWATFGGAVEPGEDVMPAALREVREEIGLDLPAPDLIGMFGESPAYTVSYADGSSQAYVVTMFGCVIDRGTAAIVPDGVEILDAQWFSPGDLSAGNVLAAADMEEIIPAAVAWFRGQVL